MPLAERIERQRAALAAIVRPHVETYGNRIFCPLSGGLDSRLLLALLREAGRSPNLYVYGGPGSEDVADRQGDRRRRGLRGRVDRQGRADRSRRTHFAAQVERNFQSYDALPNFGELFESGANAAARAARHAGGAMSASGGCGEVFRNFFYLPNRRMSAAAVARTFFARYAKGDLTEAFDERAFLRGLEDKILHAIGREGERGAAAARADRANLSARPLPALLRPGDQQRGAVRRLSDAVPRSSRRDRGDDPAAPSQECRPVRGGVDRTRSIRRWRGSPPLTAIISPSRPTAPIAGASSTPASAPPGCARKAMRSAAGWGRWRTSMAGC